MAPILSPVWHVLARLSILSSNFRKQPFRVGQRHNCGLPIHEHLARIWIKPFRIISFLNESARFLQLVSKRELNCNSIPWTKLKEAPEVLSAKSSDVDESGAMIWFSTQGNSEAILSKTTCSFSLDTKPVIALDASRRIRKLFWTEHLLMNGMKRKGSKLSPVSLVIGEGLSRDNSINIGHKLGCTTLLRLDFKHSEDPSKSNSVATFSSFNTNGCSEGYLQLKRKGNELNISENAWDHLIIRIPSPMWRPNLYIQFNVHYCPSLLMIYTHII